MKTLHVILEDETYKKLEEKKGTDTWREFIEKISE